MGSETFGLPCDCSGKHAVGMVVLQYRRRLVLRAAFLFLVPAWLVSAQTDGLAEQSRRGKDLMAQGRFEDAVGVYRAMVKAMPGNSGNPTFRDSP
jgi:hypothetical protein